MGVNLGRLNLATGKLQSWQTIKPKDQVGLRVIHNVVAITPDGKWLAYSYGNELDQLYVSEGLK